MGEDYNHGTGHGVGYLLNVHEGPQSFRWKSPAELPAPVLEEGMITSDEPGYYAENEFGIRHENLVVCKKAEKTSYGQFMKFEPLTLVPFDLEGIDPGQMEAGERKLLNQYHALVYEKISPYLNEEEKSWLKKATQEI
jgi:Xaa-Pro aminopeptidase